MVNKYHLYLKYNLLYISILIFFSNCTTYLHHRRKDIQDTITVGIEKPGYGIGLRVSYLTLGFLLQGGESADGKKDLGEGIGFRGGDVGRYHSQQLIFGILGGESFYSGEPLLQENGNFIIEDNVVQTSSERANLKSHNVKYLKFYTDPPRERQKRNKEKVKEIIVNKAILSFKDPTLLTYLPPKPKKPNGYSANYPFQFELYVGLYYGMRVGFNVAEILDFFLGIFNVDILEDDVDEK